MKKVSLISLSAALLLVGCNSTGSVLDGETSSESMMMDESSSVMMDSSDAMMMDSSSSTSDDSMMMESSSAMSDDAMMAQ